MKFYNREKELRLLQKIAQRSQDSAEAAGGYKVEYKGLSMSDM
jgi:hypothetical protein